MKLLLLLLFFFSSLYSAISEFKPDDYHLIIGKNFNDEALDIVEDHDYGISVLGYTQDFKTYTEPTQSFYNAFDYLQSVQSHAGEQLRLVKLNQAAEIVNDTMFRLSDFNRGSSIVKNAENGYLVGGYTHTGQMLIASLDTQGQTRYLKKFGTANFDQLNALIKLSDDSSIALGTSTTSRDPRDDIFTQGLGKNDIYLAKFYSNGELAWKRKYGSTEDDKGIDAVSTEDGECILIGISYSGEQSELTAAKINGTGDTLWSKSFPKSGQNRAFKIIKTPDNNYLISAGFENKNAQNNIRLIKINGKGKILWEKNIFKDADERLNDIVIDLKGNIIGVGSSQNKKRSDTDALVQYYDAQANLIWERTFGKNRQDAFKAVTLLHDNSFAIAGFSNSFADKARQMWILKLNDDGTLVKKQIHKHISLYEALKKEFASSKQVHIYKDLHITHDGLIFKQASSSLTMQHKSVLDDFMPRLLKVLSVYEKQIKNLQINGFTSTEWNAPESERYLNNARLSNDRAMHILEYSYKLKKVAKHHQWLNKILSTDGHSFSNLIYANDKENKIRSRRVEFEIELK